MGTKSNGKKNEIRAACQGCNDIPTRDSDHPTRSDGRINADEQIGVNSTDRAGKFDGIDSEESINGCGEENIGGILSQLRYLQEAHLAYVRAHEERLAKRLEENHDHQKKMLDEMKSLEERIQRFIEKKSKSS